MPATAEIISFENELLNMGRELVQRTKAEARRDTVHRCKTHSATAVKNSQKIMDQLKQATSTIFNQGVEVCGNSCITVSFADDVAAQEKLIKELEKITTTQVNRVKACYMSKRIRSVNTAGYVGDLVSKINKDFNQLVKDCSSVQVCPPAAAKK